jgi:hypothetical protein
MTPLPEAQLERFLFVLHSLLLCSILTPQQEKGAEVTRPEPTEGHGVP